MLIAAARYGGCLKVGLYLRLKAEAT